MRLGQIWDYFMRRKPLVVAFLVMLAGGFFGCQIVSRHHTMNSETLAPTPVVKTIDNGLALQILAKNQEPVYSLTWSSDTGYAQIEINAGSLTSETYVRILDAAGNLVAGEYTTIYDQAQKSNEEKPEKAVEYYFPDTPKSYQVALTPGMKLELQAMRVEFYSTLDEAAIPEFAPRAQNETYVVTAAGLSRADWDEAKTKAIWYQQVKRYASQQISDYQAKIPEHVLYNKTLEAEKKADIVRLYQQLRPEDQAAHTKFIEQLERGGIPTITYRGATEYKLGATVDFLEFLDIQDNEDGEIAKDALQVEGAVDFEKPGEYSLAYSVTDSDGNETRLALVIRVMEEKIDQPSPTPNEDRPANQPVDKNNDGNNAPEDALNTGAGTGVGDTVNNISETVWGALEMRVDYEPAETVVAVTPEAEAKTSDENTPSTSSKAENSPSETPRNKEAKADPEAKTQPSAEKTGEKIFLIVLGALAICGLVKFIFDHYIR